MLYSSLEIIEWAVISKSGLQDFHKDTGREERMDNKILEGKK